MSEWINVYGRPDETGETGASIGADASEDLGNVVRPSGSSDEKKDQAFDLGNPLLDAMATAELIIKNIMDSSVDMMKRKEVIALGAGLAAAGFTRYIMMHPELIEKALEQIGNSLEIGAGAAGSGIGSGTDQIAGAVAAALPGVLAGLGLVAAVPGPPVPP